MTLSKLRTFAQKLGVASAELDAPTILLRLSHLIISVA